MRGPAMPEYSHFNYSYAFILPFYFFQNILCYLFIQITTDQQNATSH